MIFSRFEPFNNVISKSYKKMWKINHFSHINWNENLNVIPTSSNEVMKSIFPFRDFSRVFGSKSLCEKYPNTDFLWSVFSRIPTEYGNLSHLQCDLSYLIKFSYWRHRQNKWGHNIYFKILLVYGRLE